MKLIDTNVLRVANGEAEQASPECVITCTALLQQVSEEGRLVLDEDGEILGEYQRNARSNGQPGVGDAFLLQCLRNWTNPAWCELATITPHDERGYEEFPDDPALASFDRSDRKFVAVARKHPAGPAIHNATDSDWADPVHHPALVRHGVRVIFLCPDCVAMPSQASGE